MKTSILIFLSLIVYSFGCDSTKSPNTNKNENNGGGVVYTRWGKNVCPQDTSLVYEGVAVSSKHNDQGGGANYLCLPSHPQYWPGGGNSAGTANLYAAEYESTVWGLALQDYVPPCAVCYTPNKGTMLMIPAMTQCPVGWHTEYGGYLVAKAPFHQSNTVFECLDGNPDVVPNSKRTAQGVEASFHHIKATCKGMKCPPYNTAKEIACVVCSK